MYGKQENKNIWNTWYSIVWFMLCIAGYRRCHWNGLVNSSFILLGKVGIILIGLAGFFAWYAWYSKRKKARAVCVDDCAIDCSCKAKSNNG